MDTKNMKDKIEDIESLDSVSGGNEYQEMYKSYYNLILLIKKGEVATGKKACCPSCGEPLKLFTRINIDERTADAAYFRGLMRCWKCGVESDKLDWNFNSYN